ncbi:hypothetical protein [Sediminibacillus albus]|uniref:Uncharacterized protein n=1 Tax=Sediminibacillus albus TaxID=407036 RepID=A0A1G8YLQ0_9BACI|nr:hypothetical protein [Sediminibacillus albus]SDK03597.1 hypothetical protein SAMN05216243_1691 [Sediminibacillus albus]
MKEQEMYKNVLTKLIDKTENSQINDSHEFIEHLIKELNQHQIAKTNNA